MAPLPPQQAGFNPLPANYYQIHLKWGCEESCKYVCGGEAWFDLNESADASFSMLKPVGGIKQFHHISAASADPYHATLMINGQSLGTAQRIWKCCTPICNEDEVIMTRVDGKPLGKLRATGGCSMSCHVLGAGDVPWFMVEMICCDYKCFKQQYKIYDQQRNMIGQVLFDECQCCDFIMDVELPLNANPDQRIMLIFAAHFLLAIQIERQQNNNNH